MQKTIGLLISAWFFIAPGTESAMSQQSQQQKQPESHKYRTILTIAGGGGGFMLGLGLGLAAYDDATYASRKVWTASLIGAAAGAVGGYLIGRGLDRRKSPQPVAWVPDELLLKRIRARRAAEAEQCLRGLGLGNPYSLLKVRLGGKTLPACQVANYTATIGESAFPVNR